MWWFRLTVSRSVKAGEYGLTKDWIQLTLEGQGACFFTSYVSLTAEPSCSVWIIQASGCLWLQIQRWWKVTLCCLSRPDLDFPIIDISVGDNVLWFSARHAFNLVCTKHGQHSWLASYTNYWFGAIYCPFFVLYFQVDAGFGHAAATKFRPYHWLFKQ